MAFFNGKKRSRLFAAFLLTLSMIATFSVPLSVYATEDNAREPTLTEGTSVEGSDLIPAWGLDITPAVAPILTPAEDTVLTPTEDPVLTPTEDLEQEPAPEPEQTPGTGSEQEPSTEPEQGSLPESNLTNYVVEYVTADGEDLLDDKVVEDQLVGSEVSENAVEIEGYSVDESSKSITLNEDENLITFIYTQVEPAEEEAPPVVEPPATGEEVSTEPAIVVDETVTAPAIVVEPTAATLTITHRLIADGETRDFTETADGLAVGQSVNLADYAVDEDYVVCISDLPEMTLSEESTTVVLEYNFAETDITESLPN